MKKMTRTVVTVLIIGWWCNSAANVAHRRHRERPEDPAGARRREREVVLREVHAPAPLLLGTLLDAAGESI